MSDFIFKSNGIYLGFINNGNIFSRDGAYLGWIENDYVWDGAGKFRGFLKEIAGKNYIVRNQLQISPLPRMPKIQPFSPATPPPPPNALPVSLPLGYVDGF